MTSAVDRLRNLPEAFTFAAFRRLTGFSDQAAAVCLHRWKRKDLIEPAGDRAGIYFNKLKCAEPDASLRMQALHFEYPSATLIGESVLHAAGWITQIPARLTVAVLRRPTYVSFRGFEIRGRPLTWFKAVHRVINDPSCERVYGMRALPPAFALADLYCDSKGWHPDPDDLDIPDDQLNQLVFACDRLGVRLPASLRNGVGLGASAQKPVPQDS